MLAPQRTSSLAARAKAHTSTDKPMGIIEFITSPNGANQKIFPAQRFLLKVMEKEPLDDTVADIELRDQFNDKVLGYFTELGFYDYLYGRGKISLPYDVYCANPTISFVFVMGRRASKTTVIGLWLAYKLYRILLIPHPQRYFGILDNDPMNISLTALGETNAIKLLSKFAGIIRNGNFFRKFMLEEATSTQVKLWTQHDLDNIADKRLKEGIKATTNSINITAAANSSGVRGENNIFVILDEFAHFAQARSSAREKPLDEEILDSLSPSVSGFQTPDKQPYGKTLLLSSPNGKKGQFYKEYSQAYDLGVESGTFSIQLATWEVNPSVTPAYLRSQYNKSRTTYSQEYGAEFLISGTAWLDLGVIWAAIDKGRQPKPPTGRGDRVYFLGVDFALSNDGTGVAIAHFEPNWTPDHEVEDALPEARAYNDESNFEWFYGPSPPKGHIVIDYAEVRYAGKPPYEHRKTLLLDDVLDWIQELQRHWPIQSGWYDQWAGEIIKQHLETRNMDKRLQMFQFTESANDSMYKLFSAYMYEYRLRLPEDKPLINELNALKVEHRHHGLIKVENNNRLHDDLFDAIIRAVYLTHCHHHKKYYIAGQAFQIALDDPIKRTLLNLNSAASIKQLQVMKSKIRGGSNSMRSRGRR